MVMASRLFDPRVKRTQGQRGCGWTEPHRMSVMDPTAVLLHEIDWSWRPRTKLTVESLSLQTATSSGRFAETNSLSGAHMQSCDRTRGAWCGGRRGHSGGRRDSLTHKRKALIRLSSLSVHTQQCIALLHSLTRSLHSSLQPTTCAEYVVTGFPPIGSLASDRHRRRACLVTKALSIYLYSISTSSYL